MHFDADNLVIRRPAMIAAGLWPGRTINDAVDAAVASHPERPALTAIRLDEPAERSVTYAELATTADRVAIGLHRLGVRPRDVVAVQLPNWWEFTVTYLACARIGAVMNPLMHIFRERELTFMLAHGEASVAIIPSSFRGHDFPAMYAGLRSRCRHCSTSLWSTTTAPTGSPPASRAWPGRTNPTLAASSPAPGRHPTTSPSSSTPRAPPGNRRG